MKTKTPKIVTALELYRKEIAQAKEDWKKKMKGRPLIKLTTFQKELLRDAIIRGHLTLNHIDNYYSHRASSSMALRRLLEAGILEEGKKKKQYVVNKKFEDSMVIWGE